MTTSSNRDVGVRWIGFIFLAFAVVAGLAVAAEGYGRGLEPLSYADRVCVAANGVDSAERQRCLEREMNERVEPWAIPLVGGLLVVAVGFFLFGGEPAKRV